MVDSAARFFDDCNIASEKNNKALSTGYVRTTHQYWTDPHYN